MRDGKGVKNRRISYVFFITIMVVSISVVVFSGCGGSSGSPTPNSTAVCDATHLNLCITETTCSDAGGYWYDDVCNSSNETIETVIFDEIIDENTTNIETDNLEIAFPEDVISSSEELEIIESNDCDDCISKKFEINYSGALAGPVELLIKVDNPSEYAGYDLVVHYQNDNDSTVYTNAAWFDGEYIHTYTDHFSSWWAYVEAAACLVIGHGQEG